MDFGDGGGTGRSVKKFGETRLVGDKCEVGWGGVPASMSLGHALDWEELAAGERPG